MVIAAAVSNTLPFSCPTSLCRMGACAPSKVILTKVQPVNMQDFLCLFCVSVYLTLMAHVLCCSSLYKSTPHGHHHMAWKAQFCCWPCDSHRTMRAPVTATQLRTATGSVYICIFFLWEVMLQKCCGSANGKWLCEFCCLTRDNLVSVRYYRYDNC